MGVEDRRDRRRRRVRRAADHQNARSPGAEPAGPDAGLRPPEAQTDQREKDMTKKTLRILLATTALAAVALTFTLQPAQRAQASGPLGTGGINGVSLDGVAPASGCDARAAATGSVVVAGVIGSTGTNGTSLDGVDAAAVPPAAR
ncbi:MAG: hypothetical protein U1E53_30125 [Dongiaceae bacterium]